jgi:hypothetical protein
MAGGAPPQDPMEVEKVDTEDDSDTAAGEGDAPEGVTLAHLQDMSWRHSRRCFCISDVILPLREP